jgi:Ca2+-binding EF-hand superfamily protein
VQASTNYKEAFSLFDTRGVGRVVLDKLGDLLRACGQNPTLAEIDDLEKSVGGECELRLEPQRSEDEQLTSATNSRLRDFPAHPEQAGRLP